MWRLDDTEGPFRIRFVPPSPLWANADPVPRKKLEPEHVKILLNARVDTEAIRDVEEPSEDTQSNGGQEVPPWAESYEFSATEVDGQSCPHLTRQVA